MPYSEARVNMIEELEAYARESGVDDLFRDMMTGCFKARPSAPVTYVLEYLASAYPEESLTHARAFVDAKDGVPDDAKRCEDECKIRDVDDIIVNAPLMEEKILAADEAHHAAPASAPETEHAKTATSDFDASPEELEGEADQVEEVREAQGSGAEIPIGEDPVGCEEVIEVDSTTIEQD